MTKIECRPFGATKDGQAVSCYTLTDEHGLSAEVITYGAILRSLRVPAAGESRDVVLGFDSVADYEEQDKYIGATVGRVCNRIAHAKFTLDGQEYRLAANSATNCLHGGPHGFHEKVWAAEAEGERLTLSYTSPDGEEGFPGTLKASVTYSLEEGGLKMEYAAVTDKATPVNLTNHSYFNLNGHNKGTVEEHRVQIDSEFILEGDAVSAPTGVLLSVEGTPFDLREMKSVGPGLMSTHPQIEGGCGYDHNYVLSMKQGGVLRHAAAVEAGGLHMDVYTTQTGLQLYTGNFLDGQKGKGGAVYPRRAALCLEAQNWPDAINHPDFPDSVLRPGETYRQTTTYRFV